ncbi:hypothetical protein [Bacillus sp. NPDC077027]|uniref:hypothetical protein n=1 Tax=Bacillus sp. NPDC077027 TaxID=3390548 RepID=UPI003D0389B3
MSKKKIVISTIIVIATIISITLFLLFNKNNSGNLLTIKTSKTLNSSISIVMKEHETENILFSSENIKNSTENIHVKKDHGEFSLVLNINNQEQVILGYGDSSEKTISIELDFNKDKNNMIVNSKVTTSLEKEEMKLTFPFEK